MLAGRQRLLVLTGAGASADAGVPTFRDAQGGCGLWQQHRCEDLASPEAFARDPELVWDWYRERRLHVAGCEPHEGQRTLALLQQHWPRFGRVLIATTNEDDLLERAGVQPVLHLHGSLFETRCAGRVPGDSGCGWRMRDTVDNSLSFFDCPRCGGRVRPGSVWFNEPLPSGVMDALHAFDAEACLVVGSSSLVQPAAAIPPELALAGRPVVEVNAVATPLSGVATLSLRGTAKELLPRLVDLLTSPLMRAKAGV